MRAVEQIIRYLHEHGSLTQEQLAHLERLGLWQRGSDDEAPPEPPLEVLHPEDWEIEVERTEERARRKSRRGPAARPTDVTAEELDDHLAERFDAWRPDLDGLVQLGRRLGDGRTWEEAAVVVRNSEPEALQEAAAESLRLRAPSLKELWTTLVMEDYRRLPTEWRRSMPAVGAYRTALAVQDYSEMSRDQWILKQPALGAVFNLRQAQRLLLRACGGVHRDQPERVVNGFHRDYHPLAYWTFVLLYNIGRPRKDGEPLPPGPGEHVAVRREPDNHGWLVVESHAAWIDPPHYVRDLEAEHQRARAAGILTGRLPREYVCPRHWDHLTDRG